MVDVYPDWKDEGGAQSIVIAAPGARPGKDVVGAAPLPSRSGITSAIRCLIS
jgi:hypothetical protein